jgi:hypothetical protein
MTTKVYYFETEGITEETIKEFIKICEEKDLFYNTDYIERKRGLKKC